MAMVKSRNHKNLICVIFFILTAFLSFYGCSVSKDSDVPINDNSYTEILTELDGNLSSNGEQSSLEGILTIPKTSGSPPVVIMIPGSGPNDMDETIGKNKPFADIAHGLAQRGIASFRFNKRSYEHPEELSGHPTVQDEILNDASNAIKQISADKSVGNIYILGHSQGAMLAPVIAENNPEVRGLILMAGSPRKFEEILYDQNVEAIDASNINEAEKQKLLSEVKTIVEQISAAKSGDSETILNIDSSYWASLNELNTSSILKTLKIPILILQGEEDVQVFADKDFTAYQNLLQDKENVFFKLYSGLNHLFMKGTKAGGVEEYQTPSVVEPQVIDDISSFIKEQDTKIAQGNADSIS